MKTQMHHLLLLHLDHAVLDRMFALPMEVIMVLPHKIIEESNNVNICNARRRVLAHGEF